MPVQHDIITHVIITYSWKIAYGIKIVAIYHTVKLQISKGCITEIFAYDYDQTVLYTILLLFTFSDTLSSATLLC